MGTVHDGALIQLAVLGAITGKLRSRLQDSR
jgi:hypothetical protein